MGSSARARSAARGAIATCPSGRCRPRRNRLRIVDAELVGAWGIGITWNDGHTTGIYSWELLRPDRPV